MPPAGAQGHVAMISAELARSRVSSVIFVRTFGLGLNICTWGGRHVTRAELRFETATSLVQFEQSLKLSHISLDRR